MLAGFVLGDGPVSTVLLHGFLGSGKNLRALALRWLERQPERRILLPDLTGHGASPPLPPGADLDVLARDVLEAATGAGLPEPLAIVGHSLGGRVALAAARASPVRISEIALLDIAPGPAPAGSPARSEVRAVLEALLAAPDRAGSRAEMGGFLLSRGLSPSMVDWLLMNLTVNDRQYEWGIDRLALEALHVTSTAEDLWSVLDARAVPIRCIRGGRSAYVGDADAERMRSLGCPVDTLPAAGHYVHVDALDDLVALL